MTDRSEVVRFLVDTYFGSDAGRAASESGFSKQQIQGWIDGANRPQSSIVKRLLHATAPDFRVIVEYEPINFPEGAKGLHAHINQLLEGYEKASGLYAFYDSMAQLIYVGKGNGNLAFECYQQLNMSLQEKVFSRGAPQPPKRRDIVRYLSAYEVRKSDAGDNAKHVESLIVRIRKPRLNKNVGKLKEAEY